MDLNDEELSEWNEAIKYFKEVIYPKVFEKNGISVDAALVTYRMNFVTNRLWDILEELKKEDDADNWKSETPHDKEN